MRFCFSNVQHLKPSWLWHIYLSKINSVKKSWNASVNVLCEQRQEKLGRGSSTACLSFSVSAQSFLAGYQGKPGSLMPPTYLTYLSLDLGHHYGISEHSPPNHNLSKVLTADRPEPPAIPYSRRFKRRDGNMDRSIFSLHLSRIQIPTRTSARTNVNLSLPKRAYLDWPISKNSLLCKNAVALAYFGSFRLLGMSSCRRLACEVEQSSTSQKSIRLSAIVGDENIF